MHQIIRMTGLCLSMFFALTVSAAATNWTGDWESNFGQLRLVQDGGRLFGDYQERGAIEGKISSDGRKAHAVFVYADGRWGYVQWRISNDQISGTWNWSADGLPDAKGKSWTATRASARTSPLKFADPFDEKYPTDPAFTSGPARNWLASVGSFAPSPAPNPRNGLSAWYSGFTLANVNPGFTIEMDVIHYKGSRTASVDMSIFVAPGQNCPQSLHTAFCEELRALADSRGYVDVTESGVTMINLGQATDEKLEATFRLPGDRNDRVVRIFDALNWYGASIHHPQRGYDYSGYAQSRPHLCEQAQCQNAVFEDIRDNPASYRGNVDRGYIVRMINLPDKISQSHQTVCCAPAPSPGPSPTPNNPGPRPLLSDAWVILDETSENLGEISISLSGSSLAASGKLRGFFETGEDHDTIFTLFSSTDEALAFELVSYAGQSGESKNGQLIVELPAYARNNPRGTLIVGDDIFLIELVKPVPGINPSDVGDTPAIGIHSVNYRLRDVPLNRTMRLRSQGDRSSGVVGAIPPDAQGLQMLACAPQINAQQFAVANTQTRLNLLSSSWCQVTNGQIAGWLPGRYLVPETN